MKEDIDSNDADETQDKSEKPGKSIASRESLQGGEIQVNRTAVFNGESIDSRIMLILEEEEYRDVKASKMQNGVIFTLLCDMTACYQILRQFAEAKACLKEAETRMSINCHLLMGQALNIFADKKCHSISKLKEARKKVTAALAIIKGEVSDVEDENSRYAAGYSDAYKMSAFANELHEDIQRAIQIIEDQHTSLFKQTAMLSLKHFKAQKKFSSQHSSSTYMDSQVSNRMYAIIVRPKLNSKRIEAICRM